VWKNKRQIFSALERISLQTKERRKCGFDNVGKALLEWCKVQRDAAGFPVSGPILKIRQKNLLCN
jgi:hypothetical protein